MAGVACGAAVAAEAVRDRDVSGERRGAQANTVLARFSSTGRAAPGRKGRALAALRRNSALTSVERWNPQVMRFGALPRGNPGRDNGEGGVVGSYDTGVNSADWAVW